MLLSIQSGLSFVFSVDLLDKNAIALALGNLSFSRSLEFIYNLYENQIRLDNVEEKMYGQKARLHFNHCFVQHGC